MKIKLSANWSLSRYWDVFPYSKDQLRALSSPQYLPCVTYSLCRPEDPRPIVTVLLQPLEKWLKGWEEHEAPSVYLHRTSLELGGCKWGSKQLVFYSSAIAQWLPLFLPESKTVAKRGFKLPSRKKKMLSFGKAPCQKGEPKAHPSVCNFISWSFWGKTICVKCVSSSSEEKDPIWLCDDTVKKISKRWPLGKWTSWTLDGEHLWVLKEDMLSLHQSPIPLCSESIMAGFPVGKAVSVGVRCRLKGQSCSAKGIMKQGRSCQLGGGLWRENLVRMEFHSCKRPLSPGVVVQVLKVFHLWEEPWNPCPMWDKHRVCPWENSYQMITVISVLLMCNTVPGRWKGWKETSQLPALHLSSPPRLIPSNSLVKALGNGHEDIDLGVQK